MPRRSLRSYLRALLVLFAATEFVGAAYVYGRVQQLVLADLVVYSALLLLLLIATIGLYRGVTVPLSELGRAVRAAASVGQPVALVVRGPKEVADLIEEINSLMAAAARQLADRDRVEVRSHARLDASLDALVSLDEHGG